MKKILLLIPLIISSSLLAKVTEEKEYFKNIVIKDCKKTETNFECKKFNRKGVQTEFVSYDVKGIQKDGKYIKYFDDYAFELNCLKKCDDKQIVIESGQYEKGVKVGVWFQYNLYGKIIKENNYTKPNLKEKVQNKERYKEIIQYSGKDIEKQKK